MHITNKQKQTVRPIEFNEDPWFLKDLHSPPQLYVHESA